MPAASSSGLTASSASRRRSLHDVQPPMSPSNENIPFGSNHHLPPSLLHKTYGRCFLVWREYCTSTAAAAAGPFTSTKTTHNPLEEFFELDRNIEDEKPIAYVLDILAIVVSQLLGSPIFLPIGSILSGPEDSEKGIFSTMKLGSYRSETSNRDGLTRKELLPQDALQVQFHPLRPFYRGEIVAWKTGNDGDKLKYGRVPGDVRPSACQALYRFMVETAPGDAKFLVSSQVFSFRNISTANESSLSTFPDEDKIEMGNRKLVQVLESVGSVKSSSSKTQPCKELQYGQVSTTELVQVVHDMLSAARINMDVEKQSLLQMTLTLQEQLGESQAVILLEQVNFFFSYSLVCYVALFGFQPYI
ncbi:hypothetical protein GIB67_027375 [Kingdonia uniflora]|uniref:Uncharacterized protein n=1 Tax=Kingdonia uniflora TaxID=39325 RepID=A0A7J7MFK0_9MAGN|nr:hypothetical protein GIB67_027375 [Kingdonia uniflora]